MASETSDINQFASQITQAEQVTGKECEISYGDAGYADTEELEKIDSRGTKVIVPSQRQALHNPVYFLCSKMFEITDIATNLRIHSLHV